MELTDHKTRSVFDRYHIVSASDLRRSAGRVLVPSSYGQVLNGFVEVMTMPP